MKAIKTMYHGPTDTNPSRMSAKASDNPAVYTNYCDEFNTEENHKTVA